MEDISFGVLMEALRADPYPDINLKKREEDDYSLFSDEKIPILNDEDGENENDYPYQEGTLPKVKYEFDA